jgi:hypothetical protein
MVFSHLFIFILQETNLHIKLRHHVNGLPDEYKLKQRVMDILADWDQLLLNGFSGGRWARARARARRFAELSNFSFVYISKSKFHGERHVSVETV